MFAIQCVLCQGGNVYNIQKTNTFWSICWHFFSVSTTNKIFVKFCLKNWRMKRKKIKANAHTNSPSERATKNGIKCHIHSVWKNKYYYIAVVLCGKLAARFFFSLPDFSVHHKRKIFHVWFIFILLALNCFELFCVVLPLHGFFHAADDFFSCLCARASNSVTSFCLKAVAFRHLFLEYKHFFAFFAEA